MWNLNILLFQFPFQCTKTLCTLILYSDQNSVPSLEHWSPLHVSILCSGVWGRFSYRPLTVCLRCTAACAYVSNMPVWMRPLLSLKWVMGIQAIESPGEGIKTFVCLILFWKIFIQLQPHYPVSHSLSLSFLSLPIFSFFGFPGTYMGTIGVQLTWARHGRASVWCSCWVAFLLRVGKQCLAVLRLYCVFFLFLRHISSQIIKIQAINKLMAAAICQK